MSLQARRELRAVIAPRYQAASRGEKPAILNEFVAATGYHRKYAIGLLNDAAVQPTTSTSKRPGRPRLYTAEVQEVLIQVWEVANRICAKRLVPFLPELVAVLERHGHLSLSPTVKKRLLDISPATVDRLLAQVRQADQDGQRWRASRSSALKQQVPIRTFAEWGEAQPGFVEADLVAHCGGDVSGSYLHTLVMTDVVTGWTECQALLFRDQQMVLQGVRQAEEQLPVPLLALDTDNGSEFLNNVLFDYCQDNSIIFTRSRPYKKNDQCYVEQKNGVIVRQFVGYERFEGVEPGRILAALYQQLRLYINFFQPSVKLISKKRIGSRVIKKYDQAQTPYQRMLAADSVTTEIKTQLSAQFESLDPVQLLSQIQALQDELWRYAYVERTISLQTAQPAARTNGTGTKPKAQATNSAQPQQQPSRRYRRSKRQRRPYTGPRWWRTRKDPFAEVWPEAQQQLEQTPDLSAKELFETLQQRHPGQFNDNQLRTFQRRVRAWRLAYLTRQEEPVEQQIAEPGSSQFSPVLVRVKGRAAFPEVTLDPVCAPGKPVDTPAQPKLWQKDQS